MNVAAAGASPLGARSRWPVRARCAHGSGAGGLYDAGGAGSGTDQAARRPRRVGAAGCRAGSAIFASFFPTPVVQVIQRDAFERLGLRALLMEPEFLATLEADVHLVADIVSLRAAMPEKAKDTARQVVRKVVDELMKKLAHKTAETIRGAVDRARRTNGRGLPISTAAHHPGEPQQLSAAAAHHHPGAPPSVTGVIRKSRGTLTM